MFDIGWGEIVLILIIALMVVGPGNLPKVARQLGKTAAWLRHLMLTLQREINMELRQLELKDLERRPASTAPPATPPAQPTAETPSGGTAYDQSPPPPETTAAAEQSPPAKVLHDLPAALGSPASPETEVPPAEEPKP
jgi:sec-independent protein translocase protein TatB